MRLLLFIILLHSYLFAVITSGVHTRITSIDNEKKLIIVETPPQAQVGMYGVIVHWFDKTHSTALSWIEVKSIEGNTSTLSMVPIHALEQSALPSGRWEPHVGDEVVLGYNYHRALLIAPNLSVYKKVTDFHPERTWVHPDIFAAVLSSHGHPTPLKEDFSYACRANNIGLVYFVLDDSIITVDCQSFKILQSKSTTIKTEKIQLPFYSRITHIEANWFGEGSSELEEYAPYYIRLLAKYNPQSKKLHINQQAPKKAKTNNDSSWFSGITYVSEDGNETSLDTFFGTNSNKSTETDIETKKEVDTEEDTSSSSFDNAKITEVDGETIIEIEEEK